MLRAFKFSSVRLGSVRFGSVELSFFFSSIAVRVELVTECPLCQGSVCVGVSLCEGSLCLVRGQGGVIEV